jgi:GNAT superfamily N-acetyltransferase
MTIDIREAQDADLPAMLTLYAQPGMNDGRVIDIDEAQAIFHTIKRYPSYRLFLAHDTAAPHRLLGSYALLVMHNLGHMGSPIAIVEDVVVDLDHRGQGIGRQMMAHAVKLARDAGCYKLALSSNRRRSMAHAFYESLGFERHGYSYVIETQV